MNYSPLGAAQVFKEGEGLLYSRIALSCPRPSRSIHAPPHAKQHTCLVRYRGSRHGSASQSGCPNGIQPPHTVRQR